MSDHYMADLTRRLIRPRQVCPARGYVAASHIDGPYARSFEEARKQRQYTVHYQCNVQHLISPSISKGNHPNHFVLLFYGYICTP